jgi:hypothetical protein
MNNDRTDRKQTGVGEISEEFIDHQLEEYERDSAKILLDYLFLVLRVRRGEVSEAAASFELITRMLNNWDSEINDWNDEKDEYRTWESLSEHLGPSVAIPVRYLKPIAQGWLNFRNTDRHTSLAKAFEFIEADGSDQGSQWRKAIQRAPEGFMLAYLVEQFRESSDGPRLSMAKAIDCTIDHLISINFWGDDDSQPHDPYPAIETAYKRYKHDVIEARKLLSIPKNQ